MERPYPTLTSSASQEFQRRSRHDSILLISFLVLRLNQLDLDKEIDMKCL